jgi:hypothetical protein
VDEIAYDRRTHWTSVDESKVLVAWCRHTAEQSSACVESSQACLERSARTLARTRLTLRTRPTARRVA